MAIINIIILVMFRSITLRVKRNFVLLVGVDSYIAYLFIFFLWLVYNRQLNRWQLYKTFILEPSWFGQLVTILFITNVKIYNILIVSIFIGDTLDVLHFSLHHLLFISIIYVLLAIWTISNQISFPIYGCMTRFHDKSLKYNAEL